jgi:hypothetical protein
MLSARRHDDKLPPSPSRRDYVLNMVLDEIAAMGN